MDMESANYTKDESLMGMSDYQTRLLLGALNVALNTSPDSGEVHKRLESIIGSATPTKSTGGHHNLSHCDGMSDYQFKRYDEMRDKCEGLERQLNVLRGGGAASCDCTNDYQTEIAVQLARELEQKTLFHELLLKIERGATVEEIKAYLETRLEQ
ncbi:MAG: hypothetical protein FWE32_07570 [Oscillospiraceae bacterium]|nr:hypothetical protein [Oscillospiraceae bacterium]